ncbi:MAG: cytochrome c [Terracidiphilus sp.]|jgi:mono/diheme cytochrome c family protein
MTKRVRSYIALAATLVLASAFSFADDGAATYKAKCAMCHGATGTPSPAMAKAMGIKPVSDPAIKSLTEDQIISTVKNGKGKMKPVAGLTDPQIKAVAAYFKTLK